MILFCYSPRGIKMKNKYEYHLISELLPFMEEEEFDQLVEDIKNYGQIEPITLFEGKILDGRNRYRACQKLNIEVKVKEWKPSETTGLTPIQYVISTNIMRRHLNHAQRSEIGLLLLPEIEKDAEERKSELAKLRRPEGSNVFIKKNELGTDLDSIDIKISTKIVGDKVKVSGSTISQAKKIKEIAKDNPIIAAEWEKAKKGEQGVN